MHFSTALAAVAAVAPVVIAHGGPAAPQIIGLNPKDLKARDLLAGMGVRFAKPRDFVKAPRRALSSRDGTCGPGVGSCPAGQCCSPGGYCGTTVDYCYSPGCQYQYGPGCPENQTPAGTNTSSIARPKKGNTDAAPYGGGGIYDCVTPGDIAITYDDGPLQNYTAHILDLFASYNAKATFFITGNNLGKGEIDITPELTADIKRMDADGHQIASHTWTHLNLDAISSLDRKNQMWKNEMAFRNILGKFPTYMRPPYSSCTDTSSGGGSCENDLADLGYRITYFDLDTDDYEHDAPNLIQTSKNWYLGNVTAAGNSPSTSSFLVIGHDIHAQTAYNLTDFMLSNLVKLGYKSVTVGECLGDPAANWYRSAGGAGVASTSSAATKQTTATATGTSKATSSATRASTAASATSTAAKKVTPDATCGGTNQYTCLGGAYGNCCSTSGWCGSTDAYCGTGCQSAFGNCGSNGGASSSAAASKPASSAAASKASSAAAAAATKVSQDATCGTAKGTTCLNSGYGNCCSVNGWCGSTSAYCGTGCQKGYGTCT